jgi:peptidoglycan/xylan/chitin deacetylase (PgdA/CDA1 family)
VLDKLKSFFRELFGGILGLFLIYSGSVEKERKRIFDSNCITGIVFHNPKKKLFLKSIRWLKQNGYIFISPQTLIKIIKKERKPIPGAVWISFDDGWKENITNVIPEIINQNIPVTFFLTTAPIIEKGHFWWSLAKIYKDKLEYHYDILYEDLFRISENQRKIIFEDFYKKLNRIQKREAMTVRDVLSIKKIDKIFIGCHTVNHPILTNCSYSEASNEVLTSKEDLESILSETVDFFAYPGGAYSDREISIIKGARFELAATIEKRLIALDENPLTIPRFVARDSGFLSENICHMVGIWPQIIFKIKSLTKLSSYRHRNA